MKPTIVANEAPVLPTRALPLSMGFNSQDGSCSIPRNERNVGKAMNDRPRLQLVYGNATTTACSCSVSLTLSPVVEALRNVVPRRWILNRGISSLRTVAFYTTAGEYGHVVVPTVA